MCGDGPPPVYQGKTYRRERVTLNDAALAKYGSAWKNGENSSLLKDSVNAAASVTATKRGSLAGGPFGAGKTLNPTTPGAYGITPPTPTYNIDAHLSEGVYGLDDGTFLNSSRGAVLNKTPGISGAFIDSNPLYQMETYRYVEDAKGKYGVKGFNDKGIPTDFMSLGGYDVQTTTGKVTQELSAKRPEPTTPETPKDNRQRRTGSVSTSSFRIELGTPSKKSGLRIPQ